MKMTEERFDKRIFWIIGNIIFLTVLCVTMLVPPSGGQGDKYNATIHDYTLDTQMFDNCTGSNYTDYCARRGDCAPGTHVMCMYFKTGMIMGPQCEEGKMLKMNYSVKSTILDEIAKMRDEVSEGNGVGKEGVQLPKAYNLRRRLQWDHDLAFLAQIWANQCQHGLDFCRSTMEFPNPEQFVGIDTFTIPEWTSTRNTSKELRNARLRQLETKCLTAGKLKDAIQSILNLLKEGGRINTTAEIIDNYTGGRNTYLNMLYHNTTHIGCGMTHYYGYQRLEDPHPRKHDVFVLQLVCNLSHRPVVGEMVYNTTEPNELEEPTEPPGQSRLKITRRPRRVTTPSQGQSTTTDRTKSTSTSKSGVIPGIRNLVPGGRGPGVLIMPIITVEDAPPALIQQRNFGRRRSSVVSQSNYNKLLNDNQQTDIAPYSRKNSIFARAPIFTLSPRNRNNSSNSNIEDKVSLKKQLKSLLDQVPRREIPRLRELLKQMVKKHKSEERQTPRLGPVEIDTVPFNTREFVTPNIVTGEDDEELLRLTNNKFKEITHGSRLIGSDVASFPSNTDIVVIQNANAAFDTESEFEIPIIRKQKPIVHEKGKEKPKNSVKDKTLVSGHSTAHKQGSNLANTDLAIINHIQTEPSHDKPNFGNDAEREQTIYARGNKINDQTQIASDNMKVMRRLYLENEVSKLKRKLHNLRHYIRKNDVVDNARIRPVVTSQSDQRNTKYDEGKNFYMPDRAHPLHEY